MTFTLRSLHNTTIDFHTVLTAFVSQNKDQIQSNSGNVHVFVFLKIRFLEFIESLSITWNND